MRIKSRNQRIVFAVAGLLGTIVYLLLASKLFLASHLAAIPNQSALQRAIQLEPSNAEYHDRMGQYLTRNAVKPETAITQYQAATNLNPYAARYWLDLAGAYLLAGRTKEQGESLEHALHADPTTPRVAWAAGIFFLSAGDRDRALNNFRVVLSSDSGMAPQALELCWRATSDTNVVLDEALPKRSDSYLAFLKLLIDKKQTSGARTVWNRLIALKQPVALRSALPYFRFLLEQREVAAAVLGWQQLAALNPNLSSYLPSPANRVVNGGFEERVLDGGFDWTYSPKAHVDIAIDTSEFHSGTRSLSITFDGQNPGDAGIYQLIPAKPNTQYQFSAAYRTEDLVTASGPRLSISDAYSGQSYVLGDDVMGSTPWRVEQAQFRTGPDTSLLLLRVIRQPGSPLIKGKLWIDDLQLVESAD